MQIKFYGVRGSCPTPGKDTAKYGGNTACVLVTSANGNQLILDAGTGIRQLGQELKYQAPDIHILLSHNHWDHIQGFPFFIPAYLAEHNIHIYPGKTDVDHDQAILEQMTKSFFPVHHQELKANISVKQQHPQKQLINGFAISRHALNHPGGGSGYIIECDNKKLAYLTDTELNSPNKLSTTSEQWIEILRDVDLLIHDAQFLPEEMPLKCGWGHSLVGEALELATAAGVKKLLLYSHDPARTDDQIDAMMVEINSLALPLKVIAAMEGSSLNV
jgi:phosphoribosyl 1,2-cyclic phosphodiesterase